MADPTQQLTRKEMEEQASKPDSEQIHRQTRRGDESEGDPNDRDVAGALEHEETPHGWEERKHEVQGEAEDNER